MQFPPVPTHPIGDLPKVPTGKISGTTKGEELQKIIGILQKLLKILQPQLKTWSQRSPSCAKFPQAFQKSNVPPEIKQLYNYCRNPELYIQVINQMLNWLQITESYYTFKKELKPPAYINHMLNGLNIIYNFVILIPYLMSDVYLYIEQAEKVNLVKQAERNLVKRLINCTQEYVYSFTSDFYSNPALKLRLTRGNNTFNPDSLRQFNRLLEICRML